jgi:hypothetical protein
MLAAAQFSDVSSWPIQILNWTDMWRHRHSLNFNSVLSTYAETWSSRDEQAGLARITRDLLLASLSLTLCAPEFPVSLT